VTTKLEPGTHYKLGRAQLPVVVEVSRLPGAQWVLSSPGGWCKWYVLPSGEIATYGGSVRGRTIFGKANMTVDDLVVDEKAPAVAA
jgi:hypothetical protein